MATTLEELVIELRADADKFKADMIKAQGVSNDVLKSMRKSMDDLAKAAETDGGRVNQIFNFMASDILAGVLKTGFGVASNAAKELFNLFVSQGIDAAAEQEAALNDLNAALGRAGQFSSGTSKDMAQFAAGLQSTTTFADETILSASALIETLGRLDKDGLKKATQAAVNLSSALGIDLQTAAGLVGKAAAGHIETFAKYGLAIQQGATNAETFANTLTKLSSLQGAAEARTNTYAGAVAQAKNQFGEIQEAIGNIIVQNPVVIKSLGEIAKIFGELSTGIDGNKTEWQKLIGEGIIATIDSIAFLIEAVHPIVKIFDVVFETFRAGFSEVGAAVLALAAPFSDTAKAAKEVLEEQIVRSNNNISKSFEETAGGTGSVLDKLGQLRQAAESGLTSISENADIASNAIVNTGTQVAQLSEQQIKMAEEGKTLSDSLLENFAASDADRITAQAERWANELAQLQAANEAKKISQEQYFASVKALANKNAIEEKKLADDKKKREFQESQQKLQSTAQLFDGLSSLAYAGGKQGFEIGKKFQLAGAIIEGVRAVQNAYATGGPFPFNLAAAVGVAAKTEANVAAIKGASFATGVDSIPGIGAGDKFPAMLAPKEGVIDAKTNTDLKEVVSILMDQIRAGQGAVGLGGGNVRVMISVEPKEMANAIRAEFISEDHFGTSLAG